MPQHAQVQKGVHPSSEWSLWFSVLKVSAVSIIPSEQGTVDNANVITANMSIKNFTGQMYYLFNATQLQSLGITI